MFQQIWAASLGSQPLWWIQVASLSHSPTLQYVQASSNHWLAAQALSSWCLQRIPLWLPLCCSYGKYSHLQANSCLFVPLALTANKFQQSMSWSPSWNPWGPRQKKERMTWIQGLFLLARCLLWFAIHSSGVVQLRGLLTTALICVRFGYKQRCLIVELTKKISWCQFRTLDQCSRGLLCQEGEHQPHRWLVSAHSTSRFL